MMGAAAVAVVVVCAVMYTIFEVIERRKRKKFAEDIRRYIQNHKGEWTSDNQDLPCLWRTNYRVGSLDVFLRSAAWQARKTSKEKNKKSSRPG